MRLIAAALLQLVCTAAHACLFAATTPPEGWFQWSSELFGGEVAAVEKDAARDVVTVKIAETFKGPDVSRGTLTVRLSSRYWGNCKVEKPAPGAQVLVGINANGDAMLVPLPDDYAGRLRAHKASK